MWANECNMDISSVCIKFIVYNADIYPSNGGILISSYYKKKVKCR